MVDVPLRSVAAGDVDICVDESYARKVVSTADDGRTSRVTDELCIEVLYDGSADDIYASREVDDGAEGGC